MDLLEISLSVVVARFWPVLLEFPDSCQLATGWFYLWILWLVAAELDCISATTSLFRFLYSFQFFGVKEMYYHFLLITESLFQTENV